MTRSTTYADRKEVLEELARLSAEPHASAIRDALLDMAEYRRALIRWAWSRVEQAAIMRVSPYGGGAFTAELYPRQPAMPYLSDAPPIQAILETITFKVSYDGKRWRATCEGIDL